ncbi:nicotinamide-nucleotide amidohydrolase family protein [Georgenia sp. TF02-10]|uniref:CinA family protein n=1 Tax=Georgenia sp. TF02-10 TaxID=2917725 RepID=UPI001FA6AEA9|nr:nicotinamide-nucleotide amidohydrolase family protein [Georgenia sp. TF02-10]UNX56347.1 nicotinamide-nucleotide amidohydrolase family protein [Georgenia sp. TF02-10]
MLARLRADGATLAVAESLTGGQLCAALVAVPGASAVLRGAVVAYATDVKADVLGVDAGLLARHGPVHPEVAAQLADGVARLLGASHALATTGVAGPGPADGQPAGTVHVAARGPGAHRTRSLRLAGTRPAVRSAATAAALALLGALLGEQAGPARR